MALETPDGRGSVAAVAEGKDEGKDEGKVEGKEEGKGVGGRVEGRVVSVVSPLVVRAVVHDLRANGDAEQVEAWGGEEGRTHSDTQILPSITTVVHILLLALDVFGRILPSGPKLYFIHFHEGSVHT